jgi:hypothetical protein
VENKADVCQLQDLDAEANKSGLGQMSMSKEGKASRRVEKKWVLALL